MSGLTIFISSVGKRSSRPEPSHTHPLASHNTNPVLFSLCSCGCVCGFLLCSSFPFLLLCLLLPRSILRCVEGTLLTLMLRHASRCRVEWIVQNNKGGNQADTETVALQVRLWAHCYNNHSVHHRLNKQQTHLSNAFYPSCLCLLLHLQTPHSATNTNFSRA